MANAICSGMKTLAVSLERPGATVDIIQQTHEETDGLKPKWTDTNPTIKSDAPVITELGDMPIVYTIHCLIYNIQYVICNR